MAEQPGRESAGGGGGGGQCCRFVPPSRSPSGLLLHGALAAETPSLDALASRVRRSSSPPSRLDARWRGWCGVATTGAIAAEGQQTPHAEPFGLQPNPSSLRAEASGLLASEPAELLAERSGRGRSTSRRHASARRHLKSPTGSVLGSEFSGSDVSDMSFTSELGDMVLPPDRSWIEKSAEKLAKSKGKKLEQKKKRTQSGR